MTTRRHGPAWRFLSHQPSVEQAFLPAGTYRQARMPAPRKADAKGIAMPVRVVALSSPPRRVAIIKPSALSDVLNALPVLTALRRRFPDAHLAWVVNHVY